MPTNTNLQIKRWLAVSSRRSDSMAPFFYAVKTTGIFCRPGCASRTPKQENVLFFDTALQARAAGSRPCKRCQPEAAQPETPQTLAVRKVCECIVTSRQPRRLSDLAAIVGYSPAHLQRVFKRHLGLSPKDFARQVQSQQVQKQIASGASVTSMVHAAGFASNSSFYREAKRWPVFAGNLRTNAAGQQIQIAQTQTYLGWLVMAATDVGVCAVELGEDIDPLHAKLAKRYPAAEFVSAGKATQKWLTQLVSYLDVPRGSLNLPLEVQGTAFQQRVWQALRKIPAGETVTYSELATRLGQPSAVRAVASACAANQLAIVIPCHRVIRSYGSLSGYRWGVERKRALLEHEA